MQIIVLGMHRSGTSALARILNLMGIYFGTEKVSTGANVENEKGFWERLDVRTLNDSILHNANCDWDRISGFDVDAIAEDLLGTYRRATGEIILNLDAHRPWFIKEPRLCLLFPVWKPVLEMPFCVHIFRNPLEVADSLKARNAIPLDAGMALWEAYNALGIAAASSMPRLFLSYSALMSSPRTEVERLKDALMSFGGYELRSPSEVELDRFLDDKLYHHRRSAQSTQTKATKSQLALYETMREATHNGKIDTPPVSRNCLSVLRRFEESGDHLAARIRRSNARERASLTEADTRLALKSLQLDQALAAVKEKSAAVANARKTIGELTDDRNKLRTDAALKRQQIQRLTNDLSDIRTQQESMRKEFKSLEAAAARKTGELTDRLNEKSAALADAEDRVEQLTETSRKLGADLEARSKELQGAEDRVEQLTETSRKLGADLEARSKELQGAEDRVEQLTETSRKLGADLEARSKELQGAEDRVEQLTETSRKLGADLEARSKELQGAEDRVEQLTETSRKLGADLEARSKELQGAEAAAARKTGELTDRLERKSAVLAQAEGRVECLADELRDLGADLESRSNELKSVEATAARAIAQTTGENERLSRDFRKLQSQLTQAREALHRHQALVNDLVPDIEAVFLSRRWRLGHFLGSLKYWLLLRKTPSTAKEPIEALLKKHRQRQ